jgi:isocitrate/isopropylmalate dehydrogenase
MAEKTTARVVPANEFIAESLEEEATKLPPSEAAKARILRQSANLYRTLPSKNLVQVWEEKEDVNQTDARIVREATED